ncbi:transmembrane protein 186 [Temnothorax curvispinosus]|uniref:Transmembrane protein 186 n=1 Tax=Temnothorax curvispinosus TaxID=300111 RepID=A0A6J1QCC8_9HYME|nr:transmembrane protein 186 [Temnothorax curvispinosus]
MYPRLLLNLYKRSLHRASNSIRLNSLNIKTLSHAATKKESEEKQHAKVVSERFPDYKIIYIFPFVKQVCGINVVKRRVTIFAAAATPVIIGLHLAGILPLDLTVVTITTGAIMTLWLHTLGLLCNNLVGYVYLKLDEKKVILSYIDYWGKRIDLETPLDEIFPMSDNPISITDSLYRKIVFASQKPNLKINMKFGRIVDVENFRYVLGII